MKRSREKTDLAVLDFVKSEKPLVKPYFDTDAEILKSIQLALTHVPHATMKAIKVYTSKCGTVLRYRVNFWRATIKEGELIAKNSIVACRYVQVDCIRDDNKFKVTDLTQNS